MTEPTPAEWLAQFDQLDQAERLRITRELRVAARRGRECYRHDHETQLYNARHQLREAADQLAAFANEISTSA